MEQSKLREGQRSPGGRRSQALPPLAYFRSGFPSISNPLSRPAAVRARGGTGQGQHSARKAKRCYSLETDLHPQLELKARCKFLSRSLCGEASREQRRGMGMTAGSQPRTVSKRVSICLSTRSPGRITPTVQSHHGSYPHRRRWEGNIREKIIINVSKQ